MRRSRIVAVAFGVVAAAIGCSSVPDVRFGTVDGGGPDGGDAGDGATDGAPPPSCPDNPPAGAICCGKLVCEGCVQTDCTGCEAAGCVTGDVCCPVGASGKIVCKPGTCR